jgi:hypothetical protein
MTKSSKITVPSKADPPGHLPTDEQTEASNKDIEVGIAMNPERMGRKSSVILSVSDDPFAPRDGKTLLWRNVNMTLVRQNEKVCGNECQAHRLTKLTFRASEIRRKERTARKTASFSTMYGEKSLRNRRPLSWVRVERAKQVFSISLLDVQLREDVSLLSPMCA